MTEEALARIPALLRVYSHTLCRNHRILSNRSRRMPHLSAMCISSVNREPIRDAIYFVS
jgi:hypothetical protein